MDPALVDKLIDRIKRVSTEPVPTEHKDLAVAHNAAATAATAEPTKENEDKAMQALMNLLVARIKDADTEGGRRKTRRGKKSRRTRKSRR